MVQSIFSSPQVTFVPPFSKDQKPKLALQGSEKGAVVSTPQPGQALLCCRAISVTIPKSWSMTTVPPGGDDLFRMSDFCFSLDLE